jgi:single stranded DNA-binding protein
MDNTVTLVGNVTRDPEIRYTPSGQTVATFGLAVNRRWQNRHQRVGGAGLLLRRQVLGQMAENVAESVQRGTRVIVTGRLEQRSWETDNGEKRSKVEVVADEIAPSSGGPPPRCRRSSDETARPVAVAPPVVGVVPSPTSPPTTTERSRSDGPQAQAREEQGQRASRSKKKVSILTQEQVDYVDYKDVNLLRRFMSDRAKIRARRVTGNDTQQQAAIAMAIKNAREMALLPYANRVTQQRGGRDRGARPWRPGRWPAAPSVGSASLRWRRRG